MRNLYIVVHPPTAMWHFFAAVSEAQARNLMIEERTMEFLYELEQQEGFTIDDLKREMRVHRIGTEEDDQLSFIPMNFIDLR